MAKSRGLEKYGWRERFLGLVRRVAVQRFVREGPCLLGIFPPWRTGREYLVRCDWRSEPVSNSRYSSSRVNRSADQSPRCLKRSTGHRQRPDRGVGALGQGAVTWGYRFRPRRRSTADASEEAISPNSAHEFLIRRSMGHPRGIRSLAAFAGKRCHLSCHEGLADDPFEIAERDALAVILGKVERSEDA